MDSADNIIDLATRVDLPSMEATVCVIGSGPGGGIVATELAKAGIDVVLLEAGSDIPDYAFDDMVDTMDISGNAELRFGFSRQMGGSSNLWSGRLARMEPIDFERRRDFSDFVTANAVLTGYAEVTE